MMTGTPEFSGNIYPGQEQSMNIGANQSGDDWAYADLLAFDKAGKHCIQSMTRAGLHFLREHTSDILISLTADVWSLKAPSGDTEEMDAAFEELDRRSEEHGLMLRIVS